MPTGIPGSSGGNKTAAKATKAQILRYGHVAAVIRNLLKERQWGPRDFNQATGKSAGHTSIYGWLAAQAGPSHETATALSKQFNIPLSDLTPVGGFGMRKSARPAKAVASLRSAAAPNGKTWVEPPANAPALVVTPATHPRRLYFTVDGDGLATLKLDVTMPVDALFPVLTILYNAGLVAQKQIEPPP